MEEMRVPAAFCVRSTRNPSILYRKNMKEQKLLHFHVFLFISVPASFIGCAGREKSQTLLLRHRLNRYE